METTTTAGTTVARISPFLAYELELQKPAGTKRAVVTGIEMSSIGDYAKFETMHSEMLRNVLPVLRPLGSLPNALPSGEIPLVEIAKLSMGLAHSLSYDWSKAEITLEPEKGWLDGPLSDSFWLHVVSQEGRPWKFKIDASWDMSAVLDNGPTWPAQNQALIFQLLHKWKFAVGFAPEQFIPLTEEQVNL